MIILSLHGNFCHAAAGCKKPARVLRVSLSVFNLSLSARLVSFILALVILFQRKIC